MAQGRGRTPLLPTRACRAPAHCQHPTSQHTLQTTHNTQDWGYTRLGRPFPEGISPVTLAEEALSPPHFQISLPKAAAHLAACLALVAAGCAWQAHMHTICPLWQKLACWLAIGTGYFGAFQAAADCAHFAFWPQVRVCARAVRVVIVCVGGRWHWLLWRVPGGGGGLRALCLLAAGERAAAGQQAD